MYTIEWKNRAKKQLRKLPKLVQNDIQAFVDTLRINPTPRTESKRWKAIKTHIESV